MDTIFGFFTVAFFACLGVLARLLTIAKGEKLKRITLLMALSVLFKWVHLTAVYVEKGAFEVAGVFAGLN